MKGALLATASFAVLAVPATAQQVAPPASTPAAAPDDADGIQQIVVTAERRSAKLQDVPIAITAVTAAQLVSKGVSDAFDVGKVTPSFNSNRTVGFGSPIMRGVGTTNVTAGDEPSVATYIDGFYQGSSITSQIPFNSVERIEVLKGPQGTLYGRNATGGLINIVTREPSSTFGFEGNVGYGNYDTLTASAYVTGGLANGVSADVSGVYRRQGKGYDDNLLTGGTLGKNNYKAVRSKLKFDFGSNNSLIIGGEYIDSRDNRANVNIPAEGSTPLTAGPGIDYTEKPHTWIGSIFPVFNVKQWDVNATLKLDLGFATLTSLSQYKHTRNYNQVEGDGTTSNGALFCTQRGITPGLPAGSPLTPQLVIPCSFAYQDVQKQPHFITQELQLASNGGGPLKWIVGGFFQSSKDGYYPLNIFYDVTTAPIAAINAAETTRAYAGFAQATYTLSNGLSFTGGVRYSSERKHVIDFASDFGQAKTFNSFTYRAAVDWRVSPELLLYATTNKGFKSGTFVTNTPTAPYVKPEVLYAYEAGFKADPTSFVRIDGSVYYYNYKDIQTFVNTPDGLSFLQNAASAHMYGMELSAEVIPARGWNINFGLGYEHARYQDFPNATVFFPSPDGGAYSAPLDVSGNRVLRTPDLTANGSISYTFDVGGAGSIALNAAVSYTDKFYWDSANFFPQKDYALVDLSAKFTTADKRWSLTVWGKNVTNHDYLIYRNIQQRYDAVAYGDPATFGASVGVKF
ncbi:TonB-dependent receptor [Sphingomonas sp. CGMCC 1.13654]|uniref:TonB-dependent receptor n=1 Tax=Sphingomonas chungangi TaxID=2683589 RepID=A0A838L4K7_9SPHN|nr:TonB-dependent receptor [Sphingomonas chungangi]MBA2933840.1 TonB-dependent receptor [Sphingomonas chungangi]MVW55170.1 TonB-dependent receptor plug domain-containing protein [Sphingomonas chungangi]